MDRANTYIDLTDTKSTVAECGYLVWSLMLIITLLSVWLVIPRSVFSSMELKTLAVLGPVHRFAFWSLASTLVYKTMDQK